MNLKMSKIGSVNYARFPKSGHIFIISYTVLKEVTIWREMLKSANFDKMARKHHLQDKLWQFYDESLIKHI